MNLSTGVPFDSGGVEGYGGLLVELAWILSLTMRVDFFLCVLSLTFFFAEDDDLSAYIFYEGKAARRRTA